MHAFDAPLHGKHINLRDFSSKYDHGARTEDVAAEEDPRKQHALWHALPVCVASVMTLVHAAQTETKDWGPEAGLMHFFLAAFLPLRIYARLSFPERRRRSPRRGALGLPEVAPRGTWHTPPTTSPPDR